MGEATGLWPEATGLCAPLCDHLMEGLKDIMVIIIIMPHGMIMWHPIVPERMLGAAPTVQVGDQW